MSLYQYDAQLTSMSMLWAILQLCCLSCLPSHTLSADCSGQHSLSCDPPLPSAGQQQKLALIDRIATLSREHRRLSRLALEMNISGFQLSGTTAGDRTVADDVTSGHSATGDVIKAERAVVSDVTTVSTNSSDVTDLSSGDRRAGQTGALAAHSGAANSTDSNGSLATGVAVAPPTGSGSGSWWSRLAVGSLSTLHVCIIGGAVATVLLLAVVVAVAVVIYRTPYWPRFAKRRSILTDSPNNNNNNNDTRLSYVNTSAYLTEPMDDLDSLYDDSFLASLESAAVAVDTTLTTVADWCHPPSTPLPGPHATVHRQRHPSPTIIS